ncbi:dihydrouridine synthase domain-containing protein [Trichoderma austrokoningii]
MWQRPLGKIPAYRLLFRPRFSAVLDTFRGVATMATADAATGAEPSKKLHGRAFYESIGSPKFIVAPMVDQSEFAWRLLTRSFLLPSEQSKLLAYTPMLHARLFSQDEKYRKTHYQAVRAGSAEPWLDGNPKIDRPLFVQFCANDPAALLSAARHVAPYCDAVDLNLGCPQGIARKGHYGAFLQEDQDLIFRLINILHKELSIPVTAKIRVLETKEKTLEYAQNVLRAGASILTVHGRRREQKGHLTGVANWDMIRFLRDNLPPETVIFANGNILQDDDLEKCLEATGADGIMSAEGNLSDPGLFGNPPPPEEKSREYWRGKDGTGGGWRVDAITRRYLDILHRYVYEADPPPRRPLFVPGDDTAWLTEETEDAGQPAKKKRKKEDEKALNASPNISALQPHLFHVLRHFVTKHTDIRDQLARARRDGIDGYERVLAAVERRVAEGLLEYEETGGRSFEEELEKLGDRAVEGVPEEESSLGTIRRCKRPWWVAQPIIRPLPSEALAKGAITLKKDRGGKDKAEEKKTEGDEKKTESDEKKAEDDEKKTEGDQKKAEGDEKNGDQLVKAKKDEVEQQTKQKIASRDELVSG